MEQISLLCLCVTEKIIYKMVTHESPKPPPPSSKKDKTKKTKKYTKQNRYHSKVEQKMINVYFI